MKNPIKTWWLKTHDNIDVCGDGKVNYSLEYLPDCAAVEFREGEHADDDMEMLQEEISKLLGHGSSALVASRPGNITNLPQARTVEERLSMSAEKRSAIPQAWLFLAGPEFD